MHIRAGDLVAGQSVRVDGEGDNAEESEGNVLVHGWWLIGEQR